MEFTAQQIAHLIHGVVEGNPLAKVSGFGKIENAEKGQITFLANPKYEHFIYHTEASVVIVNDTFAAQEEVNTTLVRVPDAYSALATLLTEYQRLKRQSTRGIQQPVYIDATAKVHENVFIGAFSYIGAHAVIAENAVIYPQVYIGENAVINEHTVLHPGVKIYNDCVVGKHVEIHAGSIIGADGFGFAPQDDGTYRKIPQIGNVVIEDFVEIGANTTIDRSTMGSTIVRKGAKLDNLIQIAHNVEIGENTVIAAQAGISGSTKTGKNVMIGGQAGIVGHIELADNVKINAQSGVSKSLKKEGMVVTGSPAYDYKKAIKSQIVSRTLPEMEQRLRELEQVVKSLHKQGD